MTHNQIPARGGESGGDGLSVFPDGLSPAAHHMRAPVAHPRQPVAGRVPGTCTRGVSSQGALAPNFPAASSNEPGAAGAFWEHVTAGCIRLTRAEDRMVWDLRAAHWRFDLIALAILARRSALRKRVAKAHGRAMLAAYRKQKAALRGAGATGCIPLDDPLYPSHEEGRRP